MGVDSTIEEHYRQESIKLKENLIEEYRAVGGDLPDGVDILTENETLNTFLTAESSVPLMAMMNRNLKSRKKHAVDHKEFGPGYRRIQGALGHSGISMKDVLHTLASSYEVLNPILGFTPGSPSRAIGYHTSQTNESSSDNNDDCNMINSSEGGSYRQFHSWKKEAKRYA